MTRSTSFLSFSPLGIFMAVVLGASPAGAKAGRVAGHFEAGGAALVGPPQQDKNYVGGGGRASLELLPIKYLGIELHAGFFAMKLKPGYATAAVGYSTYADVGAGLRLHPFPDAKVGDFWIKLDGSFISTAGLSRGGIAPGIGYDFNVAWWLRMGLYARYQHIFQPDDDPLGGADGKVFQFGLSVGLGGVEPPKDKDKDGILDPKDKCPLEAEDKDGFEDEDGCPDPDNDRDGILDANDKCPNEAEDKDGFEDADGCPDRDNDKDDIVDAIDKCPNEAEDRDGFQDDDGCPDPDRDQDGILDASDKCPSDPEDKDGFEDEDGCPDPDNDKDGILDAKDKCPNEAETVNGFLDDDGCPDVLEKKLVKFAQRILFVTGSHKLTKGSFATITDVAKIMNENPDAKQLIVEGHTDDQGNADYNMTLSQRRAQSVVDALVKAGVDAARLKAIGYGMTRLEGGVANKKTRMQNRRVVFRAAQPGDSERAP